MKWITIFLIGVLAGALGVFICLTGISPDPAPVAAILPAIVAPATPSGAIAPVVAPAPAVGAVPPVVAQLLIPVAGISASQLNDTFNQARDAECRHEALDIPAPKGTQVLAVADGKIVKLFDSKPGGLTVYQFDTSEKFAYYYAHLDRYAAGINEGTALKRGDLIGYVGTTGNADPATPHLHFAIFALSPDKQWWKGSPINPYPLLGGAVRP